MAKLIRVLFFIPEEAGAVQRVNLFRALAIRLKLSVGRMEMSAGVQYEIEYNIKTTVAEALAFLRENEMDLICLELAPVNTDASFSLFDQLSSPQQSKSLIRGEKDFWRESRVYEKVKDHPAWQRPNEFSLRGNDFTVAVSQLLAAGGQ